MITKFSKISKIQTLTVTEQVFLSTAWL